MIKIQCESFKSTEVVNASLVLPHDFLCLMYALKMNMRLRNEYLAIALFNEITTTLFVRIPLASDWASTCELRSQAARAVPSPGFCMVNTPPNGKTAASGHSHCTVYQKPILYMNKQEIDSNNY